jgi:glycerate-2-kinase
VIQNKPELINHGNRTARNTLLDITEGAINSIHPSRTIPDRINSNDESLLIDDQIYDLNSVEDIYIIAAGKGSSAVVNQLLNQVATPVRDGILAVKDREASNICDDNIDVVEAGHPVPNKRSLKAGKSALNIAEKAGEDDIIFACITGGASAQLVSTVDRIPLSDLQDLTEQLLKNRLRIHQINMIRRHISEVKGGQLLKKADPAKVVTINVIDEPRNEPWGPTFGDHASYTDCINLLERRNMLNSVPSSVQSHLKNGSQTDEMRTPQPNDICRFHNQTVVLARPQDVCEAAQDQGKLNGIDSFIISSIIEGESREVATTLYGIANEINKYNRPIESPCLLISGGETTVEISGTSGSGGPNQEFALSFALEAINNPELTMLSIGTDGTDGPTDAAGGLVDHSTVPRIEAAQMNPREGLSYHNSNEQLGKANDIIYTGSTGTNVMDLRLILIDSAQDD